MILPADDVDFETLVVAGEIKGKRVAEGGIAPEPVMHMLRDLANRLRTESTPAGWWMVEGDEVVGLCSIKAGPSAAGEIDIGYGVAASRQMQGAATRAIGDVLTWARRSSSIAAVTAETSVDNPASQRVLIRNGFVRIGTRMDADDGDLICWRASVAS